MTNLLNKFTLANYICNQIKIKFDIYEKNKRKKYNLKRCNQILLKEFEKIENEIDFIYDENLIKLIDEFAKYCALEHKTNHYNEAVKIILSKIEPQKCVDLMLIQKFRIKFTEYRDSAN